MFRANLPLIEITPGNLYLFNSINEVREPIPEKWEEYQTPNPGDIIEWIDCANKYSGTARVITIQGDKIVLKKMSQNN